jgi:ribonuclease Y
MTTYLLFLIIGLAAGAAGIFAYFYTGEAKRFGKMKEEKGKEIQKEEKHLRELEHKLATIETKIREKLLDAKNKALGMIEEAKEEERERRQQLEKHEHRLITKEEQLEKKETQLDKKITENEALKEKILEKMEQIKVEEEKLEAIYKEQEEVLAKITQLSREEAREILLKNIERDYKDELIEHYKKIENDAKEDSKKRAKNVIVQALQKMASDVTSESTLTTVQLPSDELKGRIIGREGRNINAFEHITGVDVIVDDTPGAILISGFDLVRRYVAKKAMEHLVEDGRIQPARIEEVVEVTKKEVTQIMVDFGEKAVAEMGIVGLHPDLIKIVGRLRFRTSYGQNVLKHSMEVGYLAASMAADLELDVKVAKTAGFLHDIGKAVDHEIEGSHALISRDILKKYGLSDAIVHAVEAHHEEVPYETPEAMLVQAADALSASRPGARRETLATYLKRLQDLEDLAKTFSGIDKVYAIQAGREIRVFVKPDEVDDMGAVKLSHDIARKVEHEMAYPGTIKVNIIRETRVFDVAR